MTQVSNSGKFTRPEGLRKRRDFSRLPEVIDIPNLLEMQQESFERFLQLDMLPEDREVGGLQAVFNEVFPISNYNKTAQIEFISYELGNWECRCGRTKGIENRFLWRCSCGHLQGVSDLSRHPIEKPCPKCGEFPKYHVCDYCEKRVILKQKYEVPDCMQRGLSHSLPLKVTLRLVVWEKDADSDAKTLRDIRQQEVYLGELPIMAGVYTDAAGRVRVGDRGLFIINGTERVVVSQMHRSPGVFFKHDKGKSHASGKILYSARIIPYRGSWLEFEFDANDIIYVRIDRKRKIPATILLRALGYKTDKEILRKFYHTETLIRTADGFQRAVSEQILGDRAISDILNPETGEVLVKEEAKFTRAALRRLRKADIENLLLPFGRLLGKIVVEDIIDLETGEVLVECNQEISAEIAERIAASQVQEIEVVFLESSAIGSALHETLLKDPLHQLDATQDQQKEAQVEIYKRLRPGDPLTAESAAALFNRSFFDPKYFDLSVVGRLKLNKKLGLDVDLEKRTLEPEDIVAVVNYLLHLKNGRGTIDDIDHLGNRRVRSVGELLQNQFRIGLVRMERAIRERMSIQDIATSMPHDLINAKPVSASFNEFFGSSQLSQFMDQTNPLAELTHKRRLSALGPGGLSRERAGFEVRDVHTTHYGRICPIETPEGPNVGLIVSLSTYASVTPYGFIETPYRKVADGKVSQDISYLTALDEDQELSDEGNKYLIAQANSPVSEEDGRLVGERVSARSGGDFLFARPEEIHFMDVSPRQLVSVSTSLIPFLENDDANRALMGSNMQRQAVPLLSTEAPVVGTGMEYVSAYDSRVVVIAIHGGIVERVSADRIIVRADDSSGDDDPFKETSVDVYQLLKFQRSNQNTCVNQRPLVRSGQRIETGQVIADGPATDKGELALGRNALVAFMPWGGYNFEDAVILSEKVVREDYFTSIHIEAFETEARDTKLGREEITRDIPNVSEENLRNLDESGIVRIGAEVTPGDVLVGKITPKGETQLTPEEKLLRAIFGEKAGDVRDASLKVPPGVEGTVIDVKVFSRSGVDKDERTREIEQDELVLIAKNQHDEIMIIEREEQNKIRRLVLNKSLADDLIDPVSMAVLANKGRKLTENLLDKLPGNLLHLIVVKGNDEVNELVRLIRKKTLEQKDILGMIYDERRGRVEKGEELPPGVIKMVKVNLAVKRKLSVGDKMAGRHGNKGVISVIVPDEDMPFMPDGTPIELILNPLGVPSRMNVGQILETHLGWAATKLDTPMMTPVFDGATEDDIRKTLQEAGLPISGKTILYDGRTGLAFDQEVTVGYIYMLKLHHLVDDKIHARSIGPYSLVTQQPLGGRAQFGGQRFGEMEVWALEAYGAAYTLQELLTVKSDDVMGRTRAYQSIVKGEVMQEPGIPESFNVLVKELQSLALDVELIDTQRTTHNRVLE